MNLASQSQKSLTALVSFLNSHSQEPFTQKELQWLFQVPSVTRVLNRVIGATLEGSECVLGVDELQVYEYPILCDAERRFASLDDGTVDGTRSTRSEAEVR